MENKFKIPGYKLPENWFSYVVIPGLILAGLYLFGALPGAISWVNHLIAEIQLFVDSLIKLVVTVVATGIAVYVIKDNLMSLLYAYKNFSRTISRLIVKWDPVGTLETYLARMRKELEQFSQEKINLRGILERLNSVLAKKEREKTDNFKLAKAAEKAGDIDFRDRKLRRAERRERSTGRYKEMRNMVEFAYRLMEQLERVAASKVEDTADEVEELKEQYDVSNSVSSAMKSFWKIFRGNAKEQELKAMAVREIEGRSAAALAELMTAREMVGDILKGMDFEQGMMDEEALERFNKWKAQEGVLLSKGDKEALFEAASDEANALPASPARVETPAPSSGYGDFFRTPPKS